MLHFIFLVLFLMVLFNPWIIPWLGEFTGITAFLQAGDILTGQQLNDFIVTMVVLVLIPISIGMMVVLGIAIQVTAMVVQNRLKRYFAK